MVYLLGKKLLIIGNGFDLRLRIKSSFSDFLSTKFQEIKNLDSIIEQHYDEIPQSYETNAFDKFQKHRRQTVDNLETMLYSQEFLKPIDNESDDNEIIAIYKKNFWITYLKFLSKFPDFDNDNDLFKTKSKTISLRNWSDIEFQIQYALESSEDIFKKINREIKKNQEVKESNRLANYIYNLFFSLSYNVTYHSVIVYNVVLFAICAGWKPFNDNIYNFLFNELHEIEEDFKNYLIHNIDNPSYKQNAVNLANSLVENSNYNLINFNYTNFYNLFDSNKINVHSNLTNDGHPIFGISSLDKNQKPIFDKPYYKFSKTYRIMSLAKINNAKQIFDDDIDEIIFYGHSFSKADYLYLKTIINKYVNNKNVLFTFKYSNYKINGVLVKMENNQIDKIYNLFNNIGNQNDDSSLLQQLLLEQRIRIEEFTR